MNNKLFFYVLQHFLENINYCRFGVGINELYNNILIMSMKFTQEHEWVRLEGDSATIGITDFAQKELGDIVFVEIETEGETLDKEEVFGTIEAVKTVSDLFMPLSGEVIEVNPALEENPALVNTDPTGEGWLIKIKVSDASEMDDLLTEDAYKELIS